MGACFSGISTLMTAVPTPALASEHEPLSVPDEATPFNGAGNCSIVTVKRPQIAWGDGQVGRYTQTLAQAAGCSDSVDKVVVGKATSMHAVAALHVANQLAMHVNGVLQGRLKNRSGSVGVFGATVDQFREELRTTEQSINVIQDVIAERVDSNVLIRKSAVKLEEQLDEVEQILKQFLKSVKTTSRGTDKWERKKQLALEGVKSCKVQMRKRVQDMQPAEMKMTNVDVKQIRLKCQEVVKMLGVSHILDEATQREIADAIAKRNQLANNCAEANSQVARCRVDIRSKDQERHEKQVSFDTTVSAMNIRIESAKKDLPRKEGSFHLEGFPNDDISRKINLLWDQGRQEEILTQFGTSYKSPTFRYSYNPTATHTQIAMHKKFDDLVVSIDKRKNEHNHAMNMLESDIASLKESLKALEAKAEEAKKLWQEMAENHEPCMMKFKVTNPREYAEMTMMNRMQTLILQVAEYMIEDETSVKGMMGRIIELEGHLDEEDWEPECALAVCKSLRATWLSPDAGQVGFLKSLPEPTLKRALMPSILCDPEATEAYLNQFNEDQCALEASIENGTEVKSNQEPLRGEGASPVPPLG